MLKDENTFRFLLIVISIVQTAISLRYLKSAKSGSTILVRRDEGMVLTAIIVVFYLAYALGVLVYLVNPNWMAWSAIPMTPWLRWSGIVPMLAGAALLIWGLHHLGKNLTISISTRDDHALINDGPYRLVRHPLYVGGMIESVGVCLLMANWFVALNAALFWATIAYRTPMEEQKLVEAFGDDYRQYMDRVGRFLPRLLKQKRG